jgi:dTDP-glucose pyrophosphorylase
MIVLTLAGSGNRFIDKGYRSDKYLLPTQNGQTIIEQIISSFPMEENVLAITNYKHDNRETLNDILKNHIKNYKVVEVNDTTGQLTTAVTGLKKCKKWYNENDHIWIYNGDTLRYITIDTDLWKKYDKIDGILEVFKMPGDHWSFVDKLGLVHKVTEKVRISSLCSTGLYGFRSIKLFIELASESIETKGEHYIAPLYNNLIKKNKKVLSYLVKKDELKVVGTPDEYYSIFDPE